MKTYMMLYALAELYNNLCSGHIDDETFNRFVQATIDELPDEPHVRNELTDYLNAPYDLNDSFDDWLIDAARPLNLPTYLGGSHD